MIFTGAAQRLADRDLPRLGAMIGVGEDEIHAFLDVETNGGGYDKAGRLKMLFEPHRFYANLSGEARAKAVAAGLAYPRWGEKPYPADSYPSLAQAMAIHETAALKSASWGIGQIMGENHVAAGYDTPQAMVKAFVDGGEPAQLEAAIHFIKANHLDDELRTHNWAAFARGFNGPAYAKHGYHLKLAAAFSKWAGIRDTPWAPSDPIVVAAEPAKPRIPTTSVPPARPVEKPKPGFFANIFRGLSALNRS